MYYFFLISTDCKMKKYLLSLTGILLAICINAQDSRNLAELLGYPGDSKLLIIHADDMGLSHSVNLATIKAFDSKGITSGSIMAPCPWAGEIESYVMNHPGLDVGVHLTLTAEWELYKWSGIVSSDQISSLLDQHNHFYASVEELGKVAKGAEAEKELKAQIDQVISSGVKPSHIDTHMGSVLANPELIKVYLTLSQEYHLPVLFPRAYLTWLPQDVSKQLSSQIYLLDNLFMLDPPMIGAKWIDAYKKGIEMLKPGLNQIIVHVAVDNDEMQAISKGHDDYGSAWRQKDLDMVCSNEFKDLLKANHIILITWGQIRDIMSTQGLK